MVKARATPPYATLLLLVGALTVGGLSPSTAAEPRRALFALGDSYSSGEGAKQFLPGTNTIGTNECRRAETAYPVLVAKRASLDLKFAACSGATTKNVLTVGQEPDSPPTIYGAEPQISILASATKDDIVTIGIGGNDAGFAKIVQTCLQSNCSAKQAKWLSDISTVQIRLTETYRAIRNRAAATIFAVTYPNPLGTKNCVLGLSRDEWDFLRLRFIPSLNVAVRAAARDAGVNLIDLETSYEGFRLCEVKTSAAALNIISVSLTSSGTSVGDFLHNSFHPNARGHLLASRVVFDAITLTTGNPPPATPPPESVPPAPPPPATIPSDSVPVSATPLPPDNPAAGAPVEPISGCGGATDFVFVDFATRPVYVIGDAEPSSQACITRRGGDPTPTTVNAKGQLDVPIAKGETVVIEYLDNTGHPTQLTLKRR